LSRTSKTTYEPPAFENDGTVLNFINDKDRYYFRNDVAFWEMLRTLVTKKSFKFIILIETPSKLFNEWTFPKVCELYGLSDNSNPSIDVYPVFDCGSASTKEEKYKEALRKLFDELENHVAITLINCPKSWLKVKTSAEILTTVLDHVQPGEQS
ncbi:3572_t:CDS:2, partial [Funneliformis caledonium]